MASGPNSRRATRRQARPPDRGATGTAWPIASLVIAEGSRYAPGGPVRRRAVAGSRRTAVREIAADFDERCGEPIARLWRQAGQRLLASRVAERTHAGEDRLCLRRQVKLAGAPIGGMGAALDPAGFRHAGDQPA